MIKAMFLYTLLITATGSIEVKGDKQAKYLKTVGCANSLSQLFERESLAFSYYINFYSFCENQK